MTFIFYERVGTTLIAFAKGLTIIDAKAFSSAHRETTWQIKIGAKIVLPIVLVKVYVEQLLFRACQNSAIHQSQEGQPGV
jgi:hypothetical protein